MCVEHNMRSVRCAIRIISFSSFADRIFCASHHQRWWLQNLRYLFHCVQNVNKPKSRYKVSSLKFQHACVLKKCFKLNTRTLAKAVRKCTLSCRIFLVTTHQFGFACFCVWGSWSELSNWIGVAWLIILPLQIENLNRGNVKNQKSIS